MTKLAPADRSISAIRALLPQRHPILLVDQVTHCAPGERIDTIKGVSGSEPCYAALAEDATAPDYDYPATLVLESFVQSAALLWAHTRGARLDGVLVLAGVQGATFLTSARPGDQIRHEVVLASQTGPSAFFSGRSSSASGVVLTVRQLVLALRPR